MYGTRRVKGIETVRKSWSIRARWRPLPLATTGGLILVCTVPSLIPELNAGSPPPRNEGEGQGGGVDKERGNKAKTRNAPLLTRPVAKRQGGGVDKERANEAEGPSRQSVLAWSRSDKECASEASACRGHLQKLMGDGT